MISSTFPARPRLPLLLELLRRGAPPPAPDECRQFYPGHASNRLLRRGPLEGRPQDCLDFLSPSDCSESQDSPARVEPASGETDRSQSRPASQQSSSSAHTS